MAECSVQLPTEVTRDIAKRLNRTGLLTYVLALEESERARKQLKPVLQAAQQQLTQEIQLREQASYSIQAQIDDIKARAQEERTAADNHKAELIAKEEKLSGSFFAIGFGCTVLLVPLGLILNWVWWGLSWWLILFLATVPSLSIGVVVEILKTAERKPELQTAISEIEQKCTTELEHLARDSRRLGKKLAEANVREQTARDVLSWLQTQTAR